MIINRLFTKFEYGILRTRPVVLNEDREVLNVGAKDLEERIAENISKLLEQVD